MVSMVTQTDIEFFEVYKHACKVYISCIILHSKLDKMPIDADLDCAYFMKNRDRLLQLINFLKENPDVTDEDVKLRSTQEKITRNALGLRKSYSISAMASLSSFIQSMGGVCYFRATSLELIAGHRTLALYIIQ